MAQQIPKPVEEVFFCSCGCEAVILSYYPDDEYKEIFLSMWESRPAGKPSWSYRLRLIWQIIRKGYPYADEIILKPDDARKLGEMLLNIEFDKPVNSEKI